MNMLPVTTCMSQVHDCPTIRSADLLSKEIGGRPKSKMLILVIIPTENRAVNHRRGCKVDTRTRTRATLPTCLPT